MLQEGEVTTADLDDSGEIVCKITLAGGEEFEGVRLRMPPGFQSRLAADRDGHDALAFRAGRLIELLFAVDREVISTLPQLKSAQTRIHSQEKKGLAQLISILKDEILIGKDAKEGAARLKDEVGGGTIIFTAVPATGPPPTVTINIIYKDAKGNSTTFGPLIVLGTYAGQPTVTFTLLELIKTASTLVKIQ